MRTKRASKGTDKDTHGAVLLQMEEALDKKYILSRKNTYFESDHITIPK